MQRYEGDVPCILTACQRFTDDLKLGGEDFKKSLVHVIGQCWKLWVGALRPSGDDVSIRKARESKCMMCIKQCCV